MKTTTVSTFGATIYVGLREGYDGLVHTSEEAMRVCHTYVDEVGLCVSVTETRFIYTDGREPGVAVGLINYPRFPAEPVTIRSHALALAVRLQMALGQKRVTVVFPDDTVMLSAEASDV
jgi:hypothetical protein